jgi:hypothetical protein
VTKTMVLHPERIINLGRPSSAPALAIAWRDAFALWCQIFFGCSPVDLVSIGNAISVL